jgi:hypothetical protein
MVPARRERLVFVSATDYFRLWFAETSAVGGRCPALISSAAFSSELRSGAIDFGWILRLLNDLALEHGRLKSSWLKKGVRDSIGAALIERSGVCFPRTKWEWLRWYPRTSSNDHYWPSSRLAR